MQIRSNTGSCWDRQKWVENNPTQPYATSCPVGDQMFYKTGTTVYDSDKWNGFLSQYRQDDLDDHIHQICKFQKVSVKMRYANKCLDHYLNKLRL